MQPDFSTPSFLAAAVICTWILLFFPFAIWARRIARPDALNGIEAYVLGQTCGPVGIWLIVRANNTAHRRAQKLAREIETSAPPEIPEVIGREKRITEGIPKVDELPGGRAFKPPPTRPTQKLNRQKMDTWSPQTDDQSPN
jgi:hypothetical protein